jgi:antitoxin CcdA
MPAPLRDPEVSKKAVNVSINSDLLQQAREMSINLSQALEARLERLLRQERARRWREENREAIEEYNRYVEDHGVFNDIRRRL